MTDTTTKMRELGVMGILVHLSHDDAESQDLLARPHETKVLKGVNDAFGEQL